MPDAITFPTRYKLLRVHRVAEILDISRMTVYRLFQDGSLDGLRTSSRNIRIYDHSVCDYLKKLNEEMI